MAFEDFDFGMDYGDDYSWLLNQPMPSFDFPEFDFGTFDVPEFGPYDFPDFPEFDFGTFDVPDLGTFDPYALPEADFSLPTLDLGAPGQEWATDDFSWLSGEVPEGPDMAQLFGGEEFNYSPEEQMPFELPMGELAYERDPIGELVGGAGAGLGALNPEQQARTDLLKAQTRNLGMSGMAQLGSLGLSAGGALAKLFGGDPKVKRNPLEDEMIRAQIDKMRAEADRIRNPIRSGGGGGGGAGPLRPGGLANMEAFKKAIGLQALDQRFTALYDQVLKETKGLPMPDATGLAQQAQALIAVQMPVIREEFEKQRAAVQERANRLGTNPAAELAQINQGEQQAMAQLQSQAQVQALAFIQAQQAAVSGRLTPAIQLLQQINPMNLIPELARVFSVPAPG